MRRKNNDYYQLVSSTRWAKLAKQLKHEANWECEQCHIVTTRLAVHHTIPIENGRTKQEMEDICFCQGRYRNIQRLQVLCYECHSKIHQTMGKNTKERHQEVEQRRVERFFNTDIDIDKLPHL